MQDLLEYLLSIDPGPVQDTAKLEALLADCWHAFEGHAEEGMAGHKLKNRVEDAHWNPPMLTFSIERHGATVLGSSRAERHEWTIDMAARTASCEKVGHRQLKPMQAKLDVRPIAKEIAQMIMDHREDERLKWNKDGSVRILIGMILPTGSAVKETLIGRRKRFARTVDEHLINARWQKLRPNVYAPPAS